MSKNSITLTESLKAYVAAHCTSGDTILDELAEETARLGGVSTMQIAKEQGALMTLLTKICGAKDAIEIGTFTGYSAICIARGLKEGGRLLCLDVSEEWTTIARRYFERAGVKSKINLRIAPALSTLASLPASATFDLAFLDADKPNYRNYYEALLPRLRNGGLLLIDNVLWSGAVLDQEAQDESTQTLRQLNEHILTDPRVESVMLPIADGLTLVRKRDS